VKAIYLDAALISELGHFAGSCRSVAAALRGAGIETAVCGHSRINPALAASVQALPLFTLHPNSAPVSDPVCGWLANFHHVAHVTAQDLGRLNGVQAGDLVIYNCARPAQIAAVVSWVQQSFSPDRLPRVVIILGWHPGMLVTSRNTAGDIVEWRLTDQASCLYRFAASMIQPAFAPAFRFAAADRPGSTGWSQLLGVPVVALPYFQTATTRRRNRKGTEAPCVAFLGEQRENKGYHLVPGIVARLLASNVPLRVLVQNSWSLMQTQNELLHKMAQENSRLTLRIGTASVEEWSQHLDASDFVVLPYDTGSYSTIISGIGAEAVANAIPQAVPKDTGLDLMMREYGSPGVVFSEVTESTVADAVLDGLVHFDDLADTAFEAAGAWATRNEPAVLARSLLSI